MRFEEIVAISDSLNLLDGRLVVYILAGPTITIGYNDASRQVVAQLVHLLREPATEPVGETPLLAPPQPPAWCTSLGRGRCTARSCAPTSTHA